MVKVSIIIPNWNGSTILKECLSSLKQIKFDNFFIIVVDNNSADDSISTIKKNFPAVHIIANDKNLGFAAACNLGIKFGLDQKATHFLLLNNDTTVDPDFLYLMHKTAEEKNTGIVGAKIYYADDPKKIWFAGGKFISWRASGQHKYWQKDDDIKLSGERETDFITGCAMLIKKEVFDDIGFFYAPYFLTVEDLDFCYQAKQKGWGIKIALDAKIWHKVSMSRQGEFSFSNGYYGTRNRLIFAFRRAHNYWGGVILLCLVLPLRIIQWTVIGKRQMVKGIIFGVRDFFKLKIGPFTAN
jgi:GT2 family glycosyltransferase